MTPARFVEAVIATYPADETDPVLRDRVRQVLQALEDVAVGADVTEGETPEMRRRLRFEQRWFEEARRLLATCLSAATG